MAKWSAWVKEYMAEHPGLWETPPMGIRAMAWAMSRSETGSENDEGRFVGIASETCRRIRGETPAAERPGVSRAIPAGAREGDER